MANIAHLVSCEAVLREDISSLTKTAPQQGLEEANKGEIYTIVHEQNSEQAIKRIEDHRAHHGPGKEIIIRPDPAPDIIKYRQLRDKGLKDNPC